MLTPREALDKALNNDSPLKKSTRKLICTNSEYAYQCAYYIDEAPREDTRRGACKDPYWACFYALCIDKAPRNDTRKSACENPEWAYHYALYIDKKFKEQTYRATKYSEFQKKYEKHFKIISIATRIKEDLKSLRSKEEKRMTPIC